MCKLLLLFLARVFGSGLFFRITDKPIRFDLYLSILVLVTVVVMLYFY